MTMRAKMVLENVFANTWGPGVKAIFRCNYDHSLPEDQSFSLATPTGFMEMQVDNPEAAKQLVIGQAYYVDFSPAG